MSGEVLVGYVTGGWNRNEFDSAMYNAIIGPDADPAIGGVISSNAGALVALGRNQLATQFLGHDKEWLCSVDTDIVFATDAVSRLLEVADPVERPVVSGLYHIFWEGVKKPAAYKAKVDDNGLTMEFIDPVPDNAVMRVDAVGAGFILIHRSVFESIQKQAEGQPCWYRESVIDGKDHGEDMSFCFRCAGVGARIYLHTGVQVGHIKSAMLGKVT